MKEISSDDFKLIKSFHPAFKRAEGIRSNRYIIDWNVLMPVVAQLNDLSMRNWVSDVVIENAFGDVVTMIKWYNKENSNGKI